MIQPFVKSFDSKRLQEVADFEKEWFKLEQEKNKSIAQAYCKANGLKMVAVEDSEKLKAIKEQAL